MENKANKEREQLWQERVAQLQASGVPDVRTIIYTTNAIESLHMRPPRTWKQASDQFAIIFGDRFSNAIHKNLNKRPQRTKFLTRPKETVASSFGCRALKQGFEVQAHRASSSLPRAAPATRQASFAAFIVARSKDDITAVMSG